MSEGTVRLGILGCGHVGASVIRLLDAHADDVARRAGRRLVVARVAVRNVGVERDVPLPGERFTDDAASVVADPEVDVVVEVMGGVEPARSLLLDAMRRGKPVVTANKELLSTVGRELFEAASAAGVDLSFEGAVGGGIPLIRPLSESLAGERLTRVMGIVNGTTNYVLTRMTEDGMAFADALADAERLGYAESDPSDDIEGFDAAAKCAILAQVALHAPVVAADVYREGISGVSLEDVEFARRLGYVVKLLAVAELEDGEVAVRVHPAMVPVDHPLAAVREAFNAVFVEGPTVGELMFFGRGAGGDPTATAVVGDAIDVARNLAAGRRGITRWVGRERRLRSIEAMAGQYYLLLDVADRPGVLAAVADAFGHHGISIKSVWQEGFGAEALLVMITHRANEGDLRRTVGDLRRLEAVAEVRRVMRVEGAES